MRQERFRRSTVVLLLCGLVAHLSWAKGGGETAGGSAVPPLPVVETELSSVPVAAYVLAVDGRSSRTVLLDTASHAVRVFDPRGREEVSKTLRAPATFSWEFILAFAATEGGDLLALTTSGGIALFEDFEFHRIVPLDRPPSVATDLAFRGAGELLFSRMFPADPGLFGADQEYTILTSVTAEGNLENLAFPIEPTASESFLRRTSQRQVKIAVDERGTVWVADTMAFRIRKLSPAGRVLETVEDPDETASVENDTEFDPARGHGRSLAGPGRNVKPRGESIVLHPIIRDVAVAGGYIWVLVRDDSAPGGERLDIVLPAEKLQRVSLPLPATMTHMRSLGVTRRLVVLCPADRGRPVTLDRDELERLAEERLLKQPDVSATSASSGGDSQVQLATP